MISAPSRRLAVLLGVIAVLTACGGAPVSTPGAADVGDAGRVPVEGGGSYTDITPAQLDATLGEDGFVLVNVHVPYEGEIEETTDAATDSATRIARANSHVCNRAAASHSSRPSIGMV